MNGYLTNPVVFLIQTAFSLYILAVMLRFLLQWVRADFYNPLSQFIVKVTNPPLVPLRRILPGAGGLDLAAVILMLALAMLELLIVYSLKGFTPGPVLLLARAVAQLIELFLNIFMVTIIIQVVLSWVAPQQYNPVTVLLHQLNDPLLRPLRRVLPDMGGLDFSPLVALVLIQLSKMILLPPLYTLG